MAQIVCPKCDSLTERAGFAAWRIVIAVLFCPLGLLALRGGRQPTTCSVCGNVFKV